MTNPFQPIYGQMNQMNGLLNDLSKDVSKLKERLIEPLKQANQKYGNAKVCGARYGVHANTIRNWHKAGYFPSTIVDGVRLYQFAEIDSFLKSRTVAA